MADALSPGSTTSEHKMAKQAGWIGTALMALGFIAEMLAPMQGSDTKWIALTAMVVGALYALLTQIFGYMRPRAVVKSAHENRLAVESVERTNLAVPKPGPVAHMPAPPRP